MDNITGIEKKIEDAVIAYEVTLDTLLESQIECKKKAKSYYPMKLDDYISEYERDVYCIIRRWNILKEKIRKIDQLERVKIVDSIAPMQEIADKKLQGIIFELRSVDEISVEFNDEEDIDDTWGEGQEWKEGYNDDGFIF